MPIMKKYTILTFYNTNTKSIYNIANPKYNKDTAEAVPLLISL